MKKTFRKGITLILVTAFLCSMCACALPPEVPPDVQEYINEIYGYIAYNSAYGSDSVSSEISGEIIRYSLATKEEGIECRLSNEKYFNNLNKYDLDFRMHKDYDVSNGPAEFMEYAAEQVLDFTDEEKAFIDESISRIEDNIKEYGLINVPDIERIWFIKTTMADEGSAGGYTHQSQIYLGQELLDMCLENKDDELYQIFFDSIIWHELFHVFTRNNKEFKQAVYGIVGATVLDGEISFPEEISERIMSNPDVEVFDSVVPLTINGEKRSCAVIPYYFRSYEGEDDTFFDAVESKLYPIDSNGEFYSIDEAPDFWDVFGRNTDYILAIEETLADNFSYAVTYYLTDPEHYIFESPEILEAVIDYLQGNTAD